jgi:protein-tyrosine phosphatase
MRVLFVCAGNTCRSVIAEFLLKKLDKDNKFEVKSAGVSATPGAPISKVVQESLKKEGITTPEGGFAKRVDESLLTWADIVLTMENSLKENLHLNFPESKDKIKLFSEYVNKSNLEILDPAGGSWEAYEKVISDIKNLILALLNRH